MHDRHALQRNAETIRHKLRECRLVPLPVAVRPGEHFYRAYRIDANLCRLPQADARTKRSDRLRGRYAARLDVAAHAETALQAAVGSLGLARREAVPVGCLHR